MLDPKLMTQRALTLNLRAETEVVIQLDRKVLRWVVMRDLLPEELIESLLQQAVILTLQSHGYTSIQPRALNLLIEVVEKRNFPEILQN